MMSVNKTKIKKITPKSSPKKLKSTPKSVSRRKSTPKSSPKRTIKKNRNLDKQSTKLPIIDNDFDKEVAINNSNLLINGSSSNFSCVEDNNQNKDIFVLEFLSGHATLIKNFFKVLTSVVKEATITFDERYIKINAQDKKPETGDNLLYSFNKAISLLIDGHRCKKYIYNNNSPLTFGFEAKTFSKHLTFKKKEALTLKLTKDKLNVLEGTIITENLPSTYFTVKIYQRQGFELKLPKINHFPINISKVLLQKVFAATKGRKQIYVKAQSRYIEFSSQLTGIDSTKIKSGEVIELEKDYGSFFGIFSTQQLNCFKDITSLSEMVSFYLSSDNSHNYLRFNVYISYIGFVEGILHNYEITNGKQVID